MAATGVAVVTKMQLSGKLSDNKGRNFIMWLFLASGKMSRSQRSKGGIGLTDAVQFGR